MYFVLFQSLMFIVICLMVQHMVKFINVSWVLKSGKYSAVIKNRVINLPTRQIEGMRFEQN